MLKVLQGVLSILALISIVTVIFLDMEGFIYAAVVFAAAALAVQVFSRRKTAQETK